MLFRAEVARAQRNRSLGAIRLRPPAAVRWLAPLAGLLLAALVAFVCSASYARRTHVPGLLVPVQGLASVESPAQGVLARLTIADGEAVAAGQSLGQVAVAASPANAGDRADGLRQALEQRRQQLESVRALSAAQLPARLVALSAQQRQLDAESGALRAEVALRLDLSTEAEETLARWRGLHEQRFISSLQLQQQREKALAARAELQRLRREAAALQRARQALSQTIAELPTQAAQADEVLARDLGSLERQLLELQAARFITLTAPIAGVVAGIEIKTGESVRPGQLLLSVMPADARLQADLLVPSRAVGLVSPGSAVALRYQAFPHQKFGHQRGEVLAVGRHALDPQESRSLLRGMAVAEPFYRVTVRLEHQTVAFAGETRPLRAGMLLDADILGERRRLVEWMFEPLQVLRSTIQLG